MAITGYPNLNGVKDEQVQQQLKLIWDALIAVSAASAGAATTDLSGVNTAITDEKRRRERLERAVASGWAVLQNTAQTIPASVVTGVNFDTARYDPEGLFVLGGSKAKVRKDGRYLLTTQVLYTAAAGGFRFLYIYKNGSIIREADRALGAVGSASMLVGCMVDRAVAGDVYEVKTFQNSSGGSLALLPGNFQPSFEGQWVGAY